ncbi:hypothetical protein GTW51_02050 [Aurantimonas aggregata]|uniref:DUF6894 domain-containing protein n=1 Tax=Aurantimonas aggregata TaxID=2047720 RepID=A0A6L9MCD2_9HYPH|nr:hypothetical protein [Aurantimonas aggregata]NDV85475.1 hypothetical protein [Aurantimonas aggregata]
MRLLINCAPRYLLPRFYFDIDEDGALAPDEEGIECETRDAVRETAIDALPGLAADLAMPGDRHVLKIMVRDEEGEPVFHASLTVEAGWR